ncbi:MAG: recombinase, partial [Phocaeicola vulgatus]
ELYLKDAEQQIQAVQNNALLDYREFKWLQQEYARLTALNKNQTEQMQTFLDQLAEPSVRERIFSIADALIGGQPVAVSSGGGGGNADSDLRWDGKRPDEEEESYRFRCMTTAITMVIKSKKSRTRSR